MMAKMDHTLGYDWLRKLLFKPRKIPQKGSNLSFIPPIKEEPSQTRIIYTVYGPDTFQEHTFISPNILPELPPKDRILWIDLIGLRETALIERIGQLFNIHPLIIEDILTLEERPKMEVYDNYIYFVIQNLVWNRETLKIETEQFSIILGDSFVLSFQEREPDEFDPIREQLRTPKGRIKKPGPDYLMHALLDTIVDNYFPLLGKLEEKIESIDEELIHPEPKILQSIHELKQQMLFLRKSIVPLRDYMAKLERDESPLLTKKLRPFFRDLYDHIIQISDNIENNRDFLTNMLLTYQSGIANKMNEIVGVLTVISTIFMPPTLIAGIYGMNFKYFPELDWKYGYPLILGVMIGVVVLMVMYFRRKGWSFG
jgi:magnesium transporter